MRRCGHRFSSLQEGSTSDDYDNGSTFVPDHGLPSLQDAGTSGNPKCQLFLILKCSIRTESIIRHMLHTLTVLYYDVLCNHASMNDSVIFLYIQMYLVCICGLFHVDATYLNQLLSLGRHVHSRSTTQCGRLGKAGLRSLDKLTPIRM